VRGCENRPVTGPEGELLGENECLNKTGDHLSNGDDCRTFYRCVWDKKVLMHCPEGTVFNPEINVCDYKERVPHCNGVTS